MNADKLPGIKEELERKVTEAILEVHDRWDRKQITDEAFLVSMDVLFRSMSGLVSEELSQLHTESYDEAIKKIQRSKQ